MFRRVPLVLLSALLATGALALAGADETKPTPPPAKDVRPVRALAEPTISADGSEIAFVSGGDIWVVPAAGGKAHLLVAHPATESRPLYSPDGRYLAFVSMRTGNGDVYLLELATGNLKRLTWDDDFDEVDGFSRDGQWVYFSSSSHDIGGSYDVFRVRTTGGTPMEVSADRYTSEYFSAPSPDGKTVAFTGRGGVIGQWWRNGHSHIDESEIWLREEGAKPAYVKVSGGGAKAAWPMWSPDGKKLYFMSDRSGAENLWLQELPKGEAQPLTHFKDGRVIWPNLSTDGRSLVFERDFAIWKLDVASGRAAAVPITLEGAAVGTTLEHRRIADGIDELALSPDGKKVAFTAHGDVFAASATEGGNAVRVSATPAAESQVVWAPDSHRLVYASDRDGAAHLFLYDFSTGKETQLTRGVRSDDTPRFSPDGKLVAFQRGRSELLVLDLAAKQEKVVATGYLDGPPLGTPRPFDWSPDSRYLAFLSFGDRMFRNVRIVPAAGGEAKPVTFLANVASNTVTWSPDGRYLLFDTGQRTETGQLARVDLVARTPKFREDLFRDLFQEETPPSLKSPATPKTERPKPETKEPAPAAKDLLKQTAKEAAKGDGDKGNGKDGAKKAEAPKPVEITFDGIRDRLSIVPVGLDVSWQAITPDGKYAVLVATVGGRDNLYAWSLDELSKEPPVAKQLTSTSGDKQSPQLSKDGKEVFYIEGGVINSVSLEAPAPKPLAVTAELDVDFASEKTEIFDQAWRYLRDSFYDSHMHGLDWTAERARYLPYAAGAQTPDELRRILSLMIGDLNASHSGIRAPFIENVRSTGYLGLRFDRAEYETSGRLRITEVVPLGPAAVTRKAKVGGYLWAVGGKEIDGRTNLDELLSYQVGRQVAVTFAGAADGTGKQEVQVRPADGRTTKTLMYREWVESRRAYVEAASHGRLGYVHMPNMSAGSLAQLFVDLDAQNQQREGVVVDIRNNTGGFVNAYALDVLGRRGYMTMTFRDYPPVSARTVLGQRSLERPTVLVTNQESLSDAEVMSEGYRALKLGKIVGEPTSGWIIYTSDVALLDGSDLRLPFVRITDGKGGDMEMHPRPVDVAVNRPVGESYSSHDSQLDAAIRELLQQVEEEKTKGAVVATGAAGTPEKSGGATPK